MNQPSPLSPETSVLLEFYCCVDAIIIREDAAPVDMDPVECLLQERALRCIELIAFDSKGLKLRGGRCGWLTDSPGRVTNPGFISRSFNAILT